MLQYYALMRMKNKMKDFEVEFEGCLEVANEYFTKELENNLAQHRVDEFLFFLKYKLEAY
jgi:peptide subunit release factor 1 (eRF1)